MKKFIALMLVVVCCFTVLLAPVSATNTDSTSAVVSTTKIDLPDGGYIIEEVTQDPNLARTSTTSGTKTSTRYDGDGNALFAVQAHGSFSYTGSSSWSTSASATVLIYDSRVTYVSKSSSYSSNYATATGNIKYLGMPDSRTATLYCDKNGNLS